MMISEILSENRVIKEIAPGKAPYWFDPRRLWGQGKINREGYDMIVRLTKNLFNQWSKYAVVLERNIKIQAKTDIRLKNNIFVFAVKKNYFKYFLKMNLKLADNDPIFQKIDSLFGKLGEGYNNTNIKHIIDAAVTSAYMESIMSNEKISSPQGNGQKQSMTAKMASYSAAGSQGQPPAAGPQGQMTYSAQGK